MVISTKAKQTSVVTDKLQSPFGDYGWFANSTDLLSEEISKTIESNKTTQTRAIIAPHAGYKWCGDVFGSVMQHIDDRYNRIIIIGPSHKVRFKNIIIGCDYDCITTPLGQCEISQVSNDCIIINNKIHYNEHSVQMHVPYVQYCCPSAKIIPLLVSDYDSDNLQTFVDCIKGLFDEQTMIMISSDFTHYGPRFNYTPYGSNAKTSIENYDKRVIEHIIQNDIGSFVDDIQCENTICGRHAIRLIMHILKDVEVDAKLCKYSMSGDLTNDYTNTVSYAGIHIS